MTKKFGVELAELREDYERARDAEARAAMEENRRLEAQVEQLMRVAFTEEQGALRDAARLGSNRHVLHVRTAANVPIAVHLARATTTCRILEEEGLAVLGSSYSVDPGSSDPEWPREVQRVTSFTISW